jgi:N-acetylmuramoyl-L-alanine amidase
MIRAGKMPSIVRCLKWACLPFFATTLLLAALAASAAAETQFAREFRMAGDASRIRVVMEFDREPDLRWFLLAAPARLVLDIRDTHLAFDPLSIAARGLVSNVRYGASAGDASRLVLTAKGPFTVERVDVLKNENSAGYRLVADLVAGSERQFRQAMEEQTQTTGSIPHAPNPSPDDRFHITIDPGHGGFDGGAHGVDSGTAEKTITLAFALELRAKLAANGAFDVSMTRDTDVFLPLDERVAIARRHEADLLISIHADTIDVPELHGATVYTVSDKASDPAAEAVAVRENLSDQLAGIKAPADNQQVADILVDLIRRETHGFSTSFARSLVDEFSHSIGMIKNPHRAAGFRVLRAPDVPSVLVELGYLSNADDEAKLRDPAWRAEAIEGIVRSVARFAETDAGARR